MEKGSAEVVALRQLRTLYALGTLGSLTDAQLLELFLTRGGDEAEDAFAALVHRHGPVVLGVCGRMLPGSHDAEDAFQATFVILARRAASISRRDQLANWLYGVAVRTAKEARRRATRQRTRERPLMESSRLEPRSVEDQTEILSLLDEELNGLPPHFRAAIVACELQGKSRREAAKQLGLPEGTLSSHIARGRTLLRKRLVKRGISFVSVATLAGLSRSLANVAVPERLFGATIRAALGYAAHGASSATVPASVAALVEGVCKVMFLTRLSMAAATMSVVLVAMLTAAAAWAAIPTEPGKPLVAQVTPRTDSPAKRDSTTSSDARTSKLVLQPWGRIEGVVRIGPRAGAKQTVAFRPTRPASTGQFVFDYDYWTHSDERGRFQFDRVIPVPGTVSRTMLTDLARGLNYTDGWQEPVAVKPGQTLDVKIGGKGRPVIGRIVLDGTPESPVDWIQNEPVLITVVPQRPALGPRVPLRFSAAVFASNIDKDAAHLSRPPRATKNPPAPRARQLKPRPPAHRSCKGRRLGCGPDKPAPSPAPFQTTDN
jgi:RNA polymerase sigma factor (sigma-70 family)